MTPKIADLALEVIPSVVANALTYLLSKTGRIGRSESRLANSVSKSESVKTLFQKASAGLGRRTLPLPAGKIDALKGFLISPELESIVKQVYSTKLIASGESHLPAIRQEFTICLALHLDCSEERIDAFASALFDALIQACEEALEIAIGQDNMAALDARAAARHSVLFEEIELIKRNLDFLTSAPRVGLKEIARFEERYRLIVEQRHGFITLPNLSIAQKVPLEQLYVPNNFFRFGRKDEDGREHAGSILDARDLIGVLDRTVVVGNPGAGKSTFSQYVCHTFAAGKTKKATRSLTPFLVILKDYGAEKKARQCSILDFIEDTSNSRYQIKPPLGAIEYLLLNGRALVVFDGLDELLDTSYRREITADVESFCTLYPSSAILITSREVGYDQAPLDPKRFAAFRIAEFDEHQVQTYAWKRFAVDDDLTLEQKRAMPRSFLEESASVSDLRSNPLMLGLMCTIYRGETYIPRNRPGVYEKCALMLFEKWDRSRQIDVRITFEDRLSPVMKHLAHWIYSDTNLQAGVTEARLINKAAEYLHNRFVEDVDVARKTARDFIEFCRGRAWVFTDTGTTGEGELLYQFTHRTFLEYFTAAQLVRTHATPDDLGNTLIPRIQKREWDIVAQLAFQIQNTNIEGAGDRLIEILVEKADSVGQAGDWPLISFGVRTLEFLVPAPRIVRELTKRALILCIRVGCIQYAKGHSILHTPETQFAQEVITALAITARENQTTVADVFVKELSSFINGEDMKDSIAAFDIVQHLATHLNPRRVYRQDRPRAAVEYWAAIRQALLTNNAEQLRERASKNIYLAKLAFHAGLVSAFELASWHRVDALFLPTRSLIFSIQYQPVVDHLLKPESSERKTSLDNLTGLARLFVETPPPWIEMRRLGNFSRMRFPQYHRIVTRAKLTDGPLFSVFILYAIFLESTENRTGLKDSLRFVQSTKNPQIAAIRDLLLARYSETDFTTLADVCRKSDFSGEQSRIAQLWAQKQSFFVRIKSKATSSSSVNG
jgi:hypothetical protein